MERRDYKITKFGSYFPLNIRKEFLSDKGISVAFLVSGVDLSIMPIGKVNFDEESDLKLEEIKKEGKLSAKHRAFEYIPNFGFNEVNAEEQTWFKFN